MMFIVSYKNFPILRPSMQSLEICNSPKSKILLSSNFRKRIFEDQADRGQGTKQETNVVHSYAEIYKI